MATITDVANEAGVSISTVSRVLNDSMLVTEEKRKRVMRAVKKVGYEIPRSIIIRNVKNKIILIISTVFIGPLFGGLSKAAQEKGYLLLHEFVNFNGNAYEHCADLIRLLEDEALCGVILINVLNKSDTLAAMFGKLPVVQIGEHFDFGLNYVVSTDDEKAYFELTSLLIAQGRKRIAFVNMAQDFFFTQARMKGYRQALQNHGLEFYPEYIYRADFSMEGGRDAASYYMALNKRPDAICCITDQIAVGCVKELTLQNVKIPDEIAVTGFDGTDISEACDPPITTVAQSFGEIGAEAVGMLDLILQDNLSKGRRVIIPHDIVRRGSTESI